jgi:hypothetical protein
VQHWVSGFAANVLGALRVPLSGTTTATAGRIGVRRRLVIGLRQRIVQLLRVEPGFVERVAAAPMRQRKLRR